MIVSKSKKKSNKIEELYDNYLGLDWAEGNVALAWMKSNATEPKVIEFDSSVRKLKEEISKIKGRKILTIEETTTTHWLYVEVKDCVDKILVCDPYRNSLLSEGAKTDKIDAKKLCQLLRSNMLKEVYHSLDEDYTIRKLVSAYEDLVKAGVRVKNQKSAVYRAIGLNSKKSKLPDEEIYELIESSQNRAISLYMEERDRYIEKFREIKKKKKVIKDLCGISGIGEISAVKIYSKVIDAERFESKYKYWAYCGLVKHEKNSGKRSYGKRTARHSSMLRGVYKSAALAAIGGNNDIREYYEYLITERKLEEPAARNQIARYIAKASYAVMKNKQEYQAYQWRKEKEDESRQKNK